MRFLKDFNVDFLIWVLQQDGLQAAPFNLHPDKYGKLQSFYLDAEWWFEWLEYVLDIQDKKVTRMVSPMTLPPDFLPSPTNPYPVQEVLARPYDFCVEMSSIYYDIKHLYNSYPGIKHSHKRLRYKQFDFLSEEEIPNVDLDLLFVDYSAFAWYKSLHGEVVVSIPLTSQEEQKERLFEVVQKASLIGDC